MKKNHKFNLFKFIRSFRVLLIFTIIIVGILPINFAKKIIINEYKTEMVNNRIGKLKNITLALKNDLLRTDFLNNTDSKDVESQVGQISNFYSGRVMIVDSGLKILYDTYMIDTGKICIYDNVIDCFNGENYYIYSDETKDIEICEKIAGTNDKNGVILVSVSTTDIENIITETENRADTIILIVLLVLIIMAVIFSIYSVKPLKNIEKTVDNIKMGNLDVKFKKNGFSEFDRMQESIEHLFERLKIQDKSREEFVSNVSHELKTPITSIKILADSLNASENVPVEMYQEFMTDIVEEINRENEIINDLLSLVRMDKKTEGLKVELININNMVEIVLKRIRPIAAMKNIELVFESFRPVLAEVDEVKMTIVISNIVENAVKYNVMDGVVKVSLNADTKYFYVKVADSGIGIPEEAKEQIFDRFYRVDKARSRETGGTGLGLAITEGIVRMHKGEIKLYSQEGEGTTVNIRIPLNYIGD